MVKVEIKRMDHFGRGIGYIQDKIAFIKNALPEEVVNCSLVEEHKNYSIYKVCSYEEKSQRRVLPKCPYYEKCGGCHLQHISYEDSLAFKKEKIKNIFLHAHVSIPEINSIENDHPYFYRNKLSVRFVNGHIGFYQENSHQLVEIDRCVIASESINQFLKQAPKLHIQNGLMTIRSNYNNELLIILVTSEHVAVQVEDFHDVKIVGIILNNKVIYGKNYFFERMNSFLFKVSYNAFFQTNPYITSKLFHLLEENLPVNSIVYDLYSGVGTLGLIASKTSNKVYSIEIVKNAVLDNLENIKLNHKDNILPFLGDAKDVLKKIPSTIDVIIVDPPRKGLDKNALEIILHSKARQIIYISCDPMTLVRDLKELIKKYSIQKYYLLDMFSYTYHVESFCLLNLR